MKVLAIIPARFASMRLPGKPLADICGKSLVQRVYEQARQAASISDIFISSDDQRIEDEAKRIGAPFIRTSSNCLTGSDRVCEAWSSLGKKYDLVANVQGDMPFINPKVIDDTVSTLSEASAEFGMSTVACPIVDSDEFERPAAVKVAIGSEGRALYFSRSPIPHLREPQGFVPSESNPYGYKHMGLYVFRPQVLERIHTVPPAFTEGREKLEQLRALAHGIQIRICTVSRAMVLPAIEVDTPEDLERARAHAKSA